MWHPLVKNDGTKCPRLFSEAIGGSVAMGQRIHRNCGVSSVDLEITPSQISLQCSWGMCGVVLSAVSTVMVPNSGSTEFLHTTATQNSFHHCFGLIWLLWTLETFECCVLYKMQHYSVKILIDSNKNLDLYFLLLVVQLSLWLLINETLNFQFPFVSNLLIYFFIMFLFLLFSPLFLLNI